MQLAQRKAWLLRTSSFTRHSGMAIFALICLVTFCIQLGIALMADEVLLTDDDVDCDWDLLEVCEVVIADRAVPCLFVCHHLVKMHSLRQFCYRFS